MPGTVPYRIIYRKCMRTRTLGTTDKRCRTRTDQYTTSACIRIYPVPTEDYVLREITGDYGRLLEHNRVIGDNPYQCCNNNHAESLPMLE